MEILPEVWNVTELEIVPYDKFSAEDYTGNYSFMTINLLSKQYTGNTTTFYRTYMYLYLWIPDPKGPLIFSRIELFPSFASLPQFSEVSKNPHAVLTGIYNDADLRNWSPGLLKNLFQFVSKSLESGTERSTFKSGKTDEVGHLTKEVLYVSEEALIDYDPFTGDESKRFDANKLFKKYDYPFEIISKEALSDKILNSENAFYYLRYVKSCTDIFLNVVNSKTGEIVYSNYISNRFKLKPKYIHAISSAAKKRANSR